MSNRLTNFTIDILKNGDNQNFNSVILKINQRIMQYNRKIINYNTLNKKIFVSINKLNNY